MLRAISAGQPPALPANLVQHGQQLKARTFDSAGEPRVRVLPTTVRSHIQASFNCRCWTLTITGVERSAGSRRLTADARAIAAWMPPNPSAGSQPSHEDADDAASLGVPALPTSAHAQALQLPTWHRQALK